MDLSELQVLIEALQARIESLEASVNVLGSAIAGHSDVLSDVANHLQNVRMQSAMIEVPASILAVMKEA